MQRCMRPHYRFMKKAMKKEDHAKTHLHVFMATFVGKCAGDQVVYRKTHTTGSHIVNNVHELDAKCFQYCVQVYKDSAHVLSEYFKDRPHSGSHELSSLLLPYVIQHTIQHGPGVYNNECPPQVEDIPAVLEMCDRDSTRSKHYQTLCTNWSNITQRISPRFLDIFVDNVCKTSTSAIKNIKDRNKSVYCLNMRAY